MYTHVKLITRLALCLDLFANVYQASPTKLQHFKLVKLQLVARLTRTFYIITRFTVDQ